MPEILDCLAERIQAFNRTDHTFPDHLTVVELFEAQVRERPDAVALVCDHDPFWKTPTLSYTELNARANQVARLLRARGVKPGDIVGVLVERSYAMVIGLFAILKAGGAYLPVSPDDPAERIAYVLANAHATQLLVHGATAAKAPAGLAALDLESPSTWSGASDRDLAPIHTPDDLAYVIYTSGSTGRPKGVMIEHASVVNRLHWMQTAYPIGPGDVLIQKTPYCFDVSVWEFFWWAMTGAALCVLRPRAEKAPQALIEAIRQHRVTVAHFVPSMLNVFLGYLEGRPERVARDLPTLRRVFTSGEALGPAHVHKFNALVGRVTGCRLTNLYGPTEATVDVTYFDCPPDGELACVPIGRPIHNLRAWIVRGDALADVGETGELCLAGIGLARGYLNAPDLTDEKFTESPAIPGERIYRTGDVARWLPDGNIEYLGREDHQVKIRGLRIEIGEIENVLRGFPGVTDCVVTVKKYSESVAMIIAYFVTQGPVDIAALRSHAQRFLPDYMVPGHFEALAALPLTSSGKADRKALPEPALARKAS